jgi:pimeloyl-ACP methyl ester carboxylesterase
MKRILQVLAICCLPLSTIFSQYAVGHLQQSFTDPARSNRTITTEIYYPATSAGDNTPIFAGQYPVLVFGHGFSMVWSAYRNVWDSLVPKGYIMVFPTTETSLSPSHSNFGSDIAFLTKAMKQEGANASSFFFNAVSGKTAVMGHSMGGGAAFLAAASDTTINAIATLAAANTNPSSIAAARNVRMPALVISGGDDCVTPPADHQVPMYDSLASDCKTFVSVIDGSHCQFANNNFNCNFGEGTCNPVPAISRATQHARTFASLVPWLNFYVKNDPAAETELQNVLNAAAGITSIVNCSAVTAVDFQNEAKLFSFYPNPANERLFIQLTSGDNKVSIYNVNGTLVQSFISSDSFAELDINQLPAGFYSLEVENTGRREAKKLIIVK